MRVSFKSVSSVLIAGLLFTVSCGKTEKKNDNVEIKQLAWVGKNSRLTPGRSIAVQGEVSGSADASVSFVIHDKDDNELRQDATSLIVVTQNPPAGKTAFSLHNDMNTQVAAGQNACNGSYTLHVKASSGSALAVKPLEFTLEGGSDCKPNTSPKDVRIGSIHNKLGPKESAFDLITGMPIAESGSEAFKDIADHTSKGSASTDGGFRQVFESGNHARFVVNNDKSFYETTKADADKLLTAGQRVTPVLRAGDVVYVKLAAERGSKVFVLRITQADKTTDPSAKGTNAGVVRFEYKELT